MSKIKLFLLLFLNISIGTACTMQSVESGHEAVMIEQPMFFGHGGIVQEPVYPGLKYFAFTTWAQATIDMRPQRFEIAMNDIFSSDNVPVDFAATIILRVEKGKSVDLVKNFGKDIQTAFDNSLLKEITEDLRRNAQLYTMTELTAGVTKKDKKITMDIISDQVTWNTRQLIAKLNMPIEIISLPIGKAIPPAEVMEQISQTASQQQRIKTEWERKIAEDSRKAAEASRALADLEYMNKLKINANQYVALKAIEAKFRAAELCIASKNSCTLSLIDGTNPSAGLMVK